MSSANATENKTKIIKPSVEVCVVNLFCAMFSVVYCLLNDFELKNFPLEGVEWVEIVKNTLTFQMYDLNSRINH